MRSLILILLLGGCTEVVQDAKSLTYDDAVEATRRNHATRFQWREDCRQLIKDEFDMWTRQAGMAENEGNLDQASLYRHKAAMVLVENFPPIVTVQTLRTAREAIENGETKVYPLICSVPTEPATTEVAVE